ncbi:hypothetical protein BGW38_000763 [Lunasporangiospora selenospora]|uniref:Uncharacterized protein n=1 Tax=Lunasporangiospora selenospora TaxID=979761 RepID=A0A9P6KEL7_9FUNG|nr:hypothetical protein BGW38_000763 [Lunasporangiospora selenospora]
MGPTAGGTLNKHSGPPRVRKPSESVDSRKPPSGTTSRRPLENTSSRISFDSTSTRNPPRSTSTRNPSDSTSSSTQSITTPTQSTLPDNRTRSGYTSSSAQSAAASTSRPRASRGDGHSVSSSFEQQNSPDRSSRGSEIMYAVVKSLPAKPAIPKLVGATGSGTVVVRRENEISSNPFQDPPKDFQRAAATRPDSQHDQANLITKPPPSASITRDNISAQRKRDSVQSNISLASTLIEGGSPQQSDHPDKKNPFISEPEQSAAPLAIQPQTTYPDLDDDSDVETRLLSIDGRKLRRGDDPSATSEYIPLQKYDGKTPLGTKRSEMLPEIPALDSTSALFQPNALLISYPALDAYLSSLKQAQFSKIPEKETPKEGTDGAESISSKKKDKKETPDPREGMFPPLNLVPTGVSLDELKANITKPSGFFDQELQNVMLTSAVDGIMSGESSNVGISWMRIEIIRDFLQFVGLYLSVSGNTFFNQKWLYTTVNIIPAVLSMDFPRAFGYGMIFLIMFAIVCCIALYTFKIMTRTDPNDDIEGLEVSSWNLRSKKARIETIAIVFLLTTLYLPLAKLSFDALVWSDTMWPIANPYKTVDFPVLEPLGPSGVYRDPSDFCYVTSMKIQDLNFAYVIIPLAIFTICVNTFYFPLAIRRLVVLNLPRIDKYTEQGERRIDLDEEYKRLTNSDNCPYNFLYNGYRREYGTYKVVVMFTKLFAVIIVVLFSKDNCLFRGFERRTIEATRASLQILFTVSLIYRHYRTQPFLYASQNLSEYWSRACTVATSIIGLFIVLKIGPLSVNTLGIMLVATYVLMCVFVTWFVVRQTQKFQVMLKQIQQRLDFSLEIFNPKLNYSKHIKRRIWQESWTTIFLVEESFKMPADKVIAFSQSPHRPPYLLNFSGSVAERHVENLRIVRQIGLRLYSKACQFLTPTMVRKRTLILKRFVGPDMYYAPEFIASNIKTYFGKAYVVPFPFSVVFVYDESAVVVTLVNEHDLDRYIQQNQDPEIQRRREVRYQLRALDGKFVVRPYVESRGVQRGRDSNGTAEMSFVNAPVSYKRGLFTIHRKKLSSWQGHNMNPGFTVTITYSDGEVHDPEGSSQLIHETTIGHDVIGITRDFQMTPALSCLLHDNHVLISHGLKRVKKVMHSYQDHYRREAFQKEAIMTYAFFVNVYDNPTLKHSELHPLLLATEENSILRHPSLQAESAISFLYERMNAVNRTRCHQWWYLFWDDLYRKNHEEISQLTPKDFSPAFPGSICYRPMSRPDLEKFLEGAGCWQKDGRSGFMHVGFLNRIYTFLNHLVFEKMTRDQRLRQLEMTTMERLRLEKLFLVTKAHIQADGTFVRMSKTDSGEDEVQGSVKTHSGHGGSVNPNSKKGWFNSITPGRRHSKYNRPALSNYSPGYIIPQTWHQKASQITALLIGGRQDDVIGDSDEEDDLDGSDDASKASSK